MIKCQFDRIPWIKIITLRYIIYPTLCMRKTNWIWIIDVMLTWHFYICNQLLTLQMVHIRPLTCSLELDNSLLSLYSNYNLLRLRLSSKGQGWRLLWGSARQSTRRYFSLRTSQEANLIKIGQPWASSFEPMVSLYPDASGRRQKSSIFGINICFSSIVSWSVWIYQ